MLPLLIVLLIGVITKNNVLAAAAGIVLVLNFLNLQRFYPLIEVRGVELGLLFLTITLLMPFASAKIGWEDIVRTLTSTTGLFAVVGGIIGAYLNSRGLSLLTIQPEIIPGILIGVVISIAFFGGISVGPVMAAGFTAVLINLLYR
ncbi:MAG: DUF441 domain-containing protein [Firmicutes bacterium]|nr:DUF441 domain-containing protein [Bacillota bacterium]